MSEDIEARAGVLEAHLATLISQGTWFSCALIGLGMLVALFGGSSASSIAFYQAGIALFILLPVAGVTVTGVWFMRRRETAFALTTAIVLVVIAASTLLGIAG